MKDGLIEVVVMKPFSTIESPQVALQLFTGTLPANSHVRTFQADKLLIRREGEGVAHYDGDPFWTGSTIEVAIRHDSFKVVVNPNKDELTETVPGKNLLQLVPDFFNEWRKMPEELINRTSQDIKRFNRNLLDRIKGKM